MDQRPDLTTDSQHLPQGAPIARALLATPDPSRRMISVLRSDHKVDRYVLHRYSGGAVAWRGDTFTAPSDPTAAERWIDYHGELTVAEVIARVPEHAALVRRWTRDEIERGVYVEGADDFVARARRERALEALRAELEPTPGRSFGEAAA